MSLNREEMFQQLLEQIGLHQEESYLPYFDKGSIEKVTVHKISKSWHFHFSFQDILPFEIYQNFTEKIRLTFSNIAEVTVSIKTVAPKLTSGKLEQYWSTAVKNSGVSSPLCDQPFKEQLPLLEGSKVQFYVENEVVKSHFLNQYLPPVEAAYRQMGFPSFKIEPLIDQKSYMKKLADFEAKKEEADALMALRASENLQKAEAEKKRNKDNGETVRKGPIVLGRRISATEEIRQMSEITEEERRVTIEGLIFDVEVRELRSERKLLILKMTDYSSSFSVKKFSNSPEDEAAFAAFKKGMWIRARGSVQEDNFMRDLVMNAQDMIEWTHEERLDTAAEEEKRVELHLHSNMSQMDATNHIGDMVAQAAKWGHKAIAITDHSGAQSFPDAYQAGRKHGVKILYGIEANIVDDGVPVVYNPEHIELSEATYVVFDVETTGLSAVYDSIIELSAVKMYKGNVTETFEEFIDPGHPLSQTTINLTGITDEMVRGSKTEEEVLKLFKQFAEGSILVAHNASFDMGFLNTSNAKHGIPDAANPVIDTLELSRFLHPELKSHRLNTLAKKYGVSLEQHHRAIYDSETTGHLCWIFLKEAEEAYGMLFHDQLNDRMGEGDAYKRARPFHATILATSQVGLKNLFKLVSLSMVKFFYRTPRIPRSELNKYREGLMVGTACSKGEVFEAMMQKGYDEAKNKAKFYDYIEVMPKAVYAPLVEQELVNNEHDLEEIIRNLVTIGKQLQIPVVATGNTHYLNPEDHIYREILIHSQGGANPANRSTLPKVHFRTTDEMLAEFSFLGQETARQIVSVNTQKIADKVDDDISPVKTDLYTPKIEGSEEEIRKLSYSEAHRLYGNPLPEIIEQRLEKELKSIIGNGFAVIYLISQKLVHKSLSDGYLVGSRGSVGSSFVATMTGITEVNPMPPHYRCEGCQYSEFFTDGSSGSGYDLPEKDCPRCGARLYKDGHDIPFETFLGFHGDKVPDIDLNFSGEYQAVAHNYTKVLFGDDYVFRAGTIGTVADRTAYGFVKGYERDKNLNIRAAEIDRLSKGATGVKRTTGQHPGGIIVIPDYMDVYDFTPIQFPADAQDSEWRTTHFDFHSIHDNVLKLDILGHDDPTVIRMLQDLSGIDPKTIPTDDPEVMKIFQGTEVLGVTPEQIESKTGTLGIPEFGTRFVRGMLEQTKPTTFAELLQISGLSHGTDVWLGNAEELIRSQDIPLSEVIGCRDDIMVYLIHHHLEDGMAFNIMEHVRKGKGIPTDWQEVMRQHNVPQWYIDSCLKIKYMFPKAHAAAYVLMALRVAYFKVHFPILYYAAYFSVRATDFDLVAMAQGKEAIKAKMKEITDKGLDASTKEKNLLTVLELCNEMVERGFNFKMIDLEKSDADNFVIEGNSLIAPFRAVPSLGANVANQIVEARKEKPFLSKEDLAKRGKVTKTVIEYMNENGVLKNLPEENQLSLFELF